MCVVSVTMSHVVSVYKALVETAQIGHFMHCICFSCYSMQFVLQLLFLLEAVVLLFSTCVFAQMAPGDEDEECVSKTGIYSDELETGVMVLLDSHHYKQLLGVRGAVWDQMDFDDNNPESFSHPTHVS